MKNIETKKDIKKEFKLLFGVYSEHIVTSLSQGKNPVNAMDRILMLVDSYKKKLEA
jgi:ribosomal protein L23